MWRRIPSPSSLPISKPFLTFPSIFYERQQWHHIGFYTCWNAPSQSCLLKTESRWEGNVCKRMDPIPKSLISCLHGLKTNLELDYQDVVLVLFKCWYLVSSCWPMRGHKGSSTKSFSPVMILLQVWCQGLFRVHHRPTLPADCYLWINTDPTTSIGQLIKSSRL